MNLLRYAHYFLLWSFNEVYSRAAAFRPIMFMKIFVDLSNLYVPDNYDIICQLVKVFRKETNL